MTKPIWIIQENEFMDKEVSRLRAVLDTAETDYLPIRFDRYKAEIPEDIRTYPHLQNRPVIQYGSKEFIRGLRDVSSFTPGAYGMDEISCSEYYTTIPKSLLLNSEYIFTTWGEFSRSYEYFFNMIDKEKNTLFVRPNSGMKTFAGLTINIIDAEAVISRIDRTSGVNRCTLILLAPAKSLPDYEHRFVIVDGNVVAGCSYSWDKDNISEYPADAFDIAQAVAKNEYQLDSAYTCDVVITDLGPKVVELNSLSCAALYECDRNKVVEATNIAAINDYKMLYED